MNPHMILDVPVDSTDVGWSLHNFLLHNLLYDHIKSLFVSFLRRKHLIKWDQTNHPITTIKSV